MAKHLAPETKRQSRQTTVKSLRLPKLPTMPKLIQLPKKKRKYRKNYVREFSLREVIPLLAAIILFVAACWIRPAGLLGVFAFLIPTVAAAFSPALRIGQQLLRRKAPDEDLLVLLAVVLAFAIGEYAAAAIAMILYRAGELVEAYVLAGGEGAVDALRERLPEKAKVVTEDGIEIRSPERVQVGELIAVSVGELIPLDGEVVRGHSSMDMSALTGEEGEFPIAAGSRVYAGCVNLTSELLVRVSGTLEDSAVAKVLGSLAEKDNKKTRAEKETTRIAVYYVPAMAALAAIVGILLPALRGEWVKWLYRASVILLLASPSALVLSIPLAYRGALCNAANRGVTANGPISLEELAKTKTMVFGKTGTITEGKYVITDVFPDGVSSKKLLAVAAAAESYSEHPIAAALKAAAGWTPDVAEGVLEVEELQGRGISAFIEGRHVYVGNAALLEEHGILYKVPVRSGAAIHVAVENVYWGHILVSDRTREGAFDALEGLRVQGIRNMVMVTGDVLSVSRPIASSMNFDMVKAELTPQAKINAIEYLQEAKGDDSNLAYVGDGIHDEDLLAAADLGLTVHALKSRSALENADIAVLGSEIRVLPEVMQLAAAARRISLVNMIAVGGTKLVLLVLALFGVLPILAACLCELAVTAFAMFNALRTFRMEL